MDEIVHRLEKAEKKIAALEETLETIKQMNISEQMQEYIESRQRTTYLSDLLNSLSGNIFIDTTETEQQIANMQAEKESVDKQIFEALAIATKIDTESATTAELFTYTDCTAWSTSGLKITGYNGFDEKIIAIPEYILGQPVIGIGRKAFYNGSMETVILPPTVVVIEESAFENCNNLMEITMSNNIKSISDKAFGNCRNLNEILLPEGLRALGNSCFENTGITKINFPSTINIIPYYCCSCCYNLRNITISEGIKSIRNGAFRTDRYGRTMNVLEKLIIPQSIELIGRDAFANRTRTHIAFLGMKTTAPETIASEGTTLYVIPGSAMQRYARENNLPMKSIKEFPVE